jgi:hypothetical protein
MHLSHQDRYQSQHAATTTPRRPATHTGRRTRPSTSTQNSDNAKLLVIHNKPHIPVPVTKRSLSIYKYRKTTVSVSVTYSNTLVTERSFSIYKYRKNNSVSVSDITYSKTLATTNAVKDLLFLNATLERGTRTSRHQRHTPTIPHHTPGYSNTTYE